MEIDKIIYEAQKKGWNDFAEKLIKDLDFFTKSKTRFKLKEHIISMKI